jgi:hypothetical protein
MDMLQRGRGHWHWVRAWTIEATAAANGDVETSGVDGENGEDGDRNAVICNCGGND